MLQNFIYTSKRKFIRLSKIKSGGKKYCYLSVNNRMYVFLIYKVKFIKCQWPHQWLSSSALKTGRREVPGLIPCRACRPSRLEFSVVFSETRVNRGQKPLGRPPRRAFHLQSQVPRVIIGLKNLQPTCNQVSVKNSIMKKKTCYTHI